MVCRYLFKSKYQIFLCLQLREFVLIKLAIFVSIAQQRCADYPGIPRGPVAILLYYDAHLALATTLKMLVQAHQGLRWKTNCSANVQKTVNKFVDDLVLDGLLEAIFGELVIYVYQSII